MVKFAAQFNSHHKWLVSDELIKPVKRQHNGEICSSIPHSSQASSDLDGDLGVVDGLVVGDLDHLARDPEEDGGVEGLVDSNQEHQILHHLSSQLLFQHRVLQLLAQLLHQAPRLKREHASRQGTCQWTEHVSRQRTSQ